MKRRRASFRYVGPASRAGLSPPRLGGPTSPHGFTLFELILSIALSAVLLTLIGTAINLYLVRVATSRTRVEEAQLARSILTMIADDIRATSIYQPQDTSAIAKLMAKSTSFDVDSIDKPRDTTVGTGGTSGASPVGGVGGATSVGSSSTASQASSGASGNNEESDNTMPLGLSGSLEELYVDVTRLPKQEELFAAATGYTNAPSPLAAGTTTPSGGASGGQGIAPPTDLKTVHYLVRPGEAMEPGSASATSLNPESQQRAGGLVRQETPRALRVFAEQNGNSAILDAGQALVAPEVMHVEFRYFNGSETTDDWDMKEQKKLPTAVEVCIWLRSPGAAAEAIASSYDAASLANNAREYRQVVYLPMSQVMTSGPASESSDSSSTDSSSSSTNASSSGSGSSFDQP